MCKSKEMIDSQVVFVLFPTKGRNDIAVRFAQWFSYKLSLDSSTGAFLRHPQGRFLMDRAGQVTQWLDAHCLHDLLLGGVCSLGIL
jgi:hypothetical protein